MNIDSRPPSYPLRLEPETRARIESLAKANGRSLNAQIVLMLDEWLSSSNADISKPLTADDMRKIAREEIREILLSHDLEGFLVGDPIDTTDLLREFEK